MLNFCFLFYFPFVGEIDRTLKRVQEGIDAFEEIIQKFNLATTQATKDKLESDLKKEIKKLQRLREQIKGWISLNEIKDKSSLMEHRRLVEVVGACCCFFCEILTEFPPLFCYCLDIFLLTFL